VKSGPWAPVPYGKPEVACIQALAAGNATPEMQRRALKWIVEIAAGYYDLSFRPGEDGRRETDFAEGKRFVGAQIVKMTQLNLSKMKPGKNADVHEPKEN